MSYRLKPDVRYANLGEKVVFNNKNEYISFSGDSVPLVLDLLLLLEDGITKSEAVKRRSMDKTTVDAIFSLLDDNDLLLREDDVELASDPVRAHLELQTDASFADEAIQRLRETEVSVVVPDGFRPPASVMYREELNHDTVQLSKVTDVLLSITYGHAPRTNRTYNDAATNLGFEFLPVRLFSDRFIVGPYVVPEKTACFDCAYRRELTTCDSPSEVHDFEATVDGEDAVIPLTEERHSLLDGIVGTEVKKILTKYDTPATYNSVRTVRFDSVAVETNHILKVPGCEHG